MNKNRNIILSLLVLFMFSSCNEAKIGINEIHLTFGSKPEVSRVEIVNNQLIVTGKNLNTVNYAQINGSISHTFDIESKTASRLVLNAKSALNFMAGQTFNLFVSNASAAAIFPISFELQNGQVTASKLNNMGATTGQVLKFNGTTWAPSNIVNSQIYAGTFNATTVTPDVSLTNPPSGTYYIVTVSGNPDLGNGTLNLNTGDIIVYNGSEWEKVAVSNLGVTSFNGRDGVVVPTAADYSWDLLTKNSGKLTGSNLADIEDVDLSGIVDGYILKWNAGLSKWVAALDDSGAVVDGSITTTKLSDGSVTSAKIVDGTIGNTDIANSSITEQKLNLSDNSVSINKIQRLACLSGEVLTSDTILGYRCVADNTTDSTKLPLAGGTMTGALVLASDPTVNLQAVTKQYVDNLIASTSVWSVSGSNIYNSNSGFVGVGTSSPDSKLTVSNNPTGLASTGLSGLVAHFGNTDSSNSRILIDAHGTGNFPVLTFRTSRGTAASPLNSQTNDILALLTATGYGDGFPLSSSYNFLNYRAGENWTSTSQGAYLVFSTVLNGSTTTSERMRITDTGNVGVGTTSPTERLHVSGNIKAERVQNDNLSTTLNLLKRRNSNLPPVADTEYSNILFSYLDTNGLERDAAKIGASVDGTVGSNDMPSRLSFFTTQDGTATLAERMRIDNAGNIGMGTTSPQDAIHVTNSATKGIRVTDSATGVGVGLYSNWPAVFFNSYFDGANTMQMGSGYSGVMVFDNSVGAIKFRVAPIGTAGGVVSSVITPLTILNSGNIGIGTTSASSKVVIRGSGTTSASSGLNVLDSSNSSKFFVRDDGNVGVGSATPQAKLHVAGNLRVDTLNAATATQVCIDGSNVLSSCSSSIRYKENVLDLDSSLSKILSLRPVSYKWINSGESDVGFIAEEVEKVDRRLVTYSKSKEIQGVKYDQLTAPIIKAIQELGEMFLSQNKASKKKYKETVSRIQKLESENRDLKRYICEKDPEAFFCTK